MRIALALSEYQMRIKYVKGSANAHVDVFTRDGVDPIDEELATKCEVFTVETVEESGEGFDIVADKIKIDFPTISEFECSEADIAKIKGCRLRRSGPGNTLYYTEGGKIYVPPQLRDRLIAFHHRSLSAGHAGIGRCCRRLKSLSWWPGLQKDVEAHVGRCLSCARARQHPKVTPGHLLCPDFNGLVVVDCVGPFFDRHQKRECYVFTAIDTFTRYAAARLVYAIDGPTLWSALRDMWITPFGAPGCLLRDNGPGLVSSRLFPVEWSGAGNLAVGGKRGGRGGKTCRFSIGPWFYIHFARNVICDQPKNATRRTVVTWHHSPFPPYRFGLRTDCLYSSLRFSLVVY